MSAPVTADVPATVPFNTGTVRYTPSYQIQYTDGNNALMQGIIGNLLQGIVGLVGIKLGSNGILAASVGISNSYVPPANPPIDGNCYYMGSTSISLTQSTGDVEYASGSIGWTQQSEQACTAMLLGTGWETQLILWPIVQTFQDKILLSPHPPLVLQRL